MAESIVDAGAVLVERERDGSSESENVDGARGKAVLAGATRQWPVGARTFIVLTGLVAAGLASALLLKARSSRREAQARERESPAATERVERRVPPLKLVPPTSAQLAAIAPRPSAPASLPGDLPGAGVVSGEAELLQRRLSRGFGSTEREGDAAPPAPTPPAETPPPNGTVSSAARKSGGLEEKLEAPELRAATAGVLPDRDRLLTQGAMLDCVLETKIVSSVAGMTSCHLTRDVYSTSGRVALLDRGSRVVGRYQGVAQQGDRRVFVLWTRVETPAGVVVELQSPGTGALGEAGLGGHVDTRFWDRFGAAILLSVIEDGVDAASARASGASQGTTINVANTATAGKEVITRSMEPTINIPPVLVKNQGERVGIFVARDLDFRSVYGLERVARTGE